MALVINASGQRVIPILLTASVTGLVLSNALDGQQVTLEFQQNSTGGWTVTSTQIPGLGLPAAAANSVSYQTFVYSAISNTWSNVPNPGGVVAAYTASGAIAVQPGLVTIGGTGAEAMTLALPVSGTQDGIVMRFSIVSAHAHTLTTTSLGINGVYDTVTFAAAGDAVELQASAGVWYRIGGAGTNTLSAV